MAEDDDGSSDFENKPTVVEPVDEHTPPAGRSTLQGYVGHEIEIARARLDQHRYDMMALRLMMMEVGVHVVTADREIAKIEAWCAVPENDYLVRVALKV